MIVQCKEEAVEKNGYRQTDRLTDRQKCNSLTQPVQGLGWVKRLSISYHLTNYSFFIITFALIIILRFGFHTLIYFYKIVNQI